MGRFCEFGVLFLALHRPYFRCFHIPLQEKWLLQCRAGAHLVSISFLFASFFSQTTVLGIVQKVFSEKASAIARMRQKCVKNASDMRQNGSCFIGKRGTSKMRQKSVKIAFKPFWLKQTLAAILPWAGLGEFAWILRIHLSYLAGLAGASLRQAFGLPQREGACLALTTLQSLSAGADFARRLSVPGAASRHGGMDAGEQTAQYPTSMDGRSGAPRTPRRNGLDAQPPLCPVPGIEGQRQRQRTGQTQTQGRLPGSISLSHCHSGILTGSRQATTQPQTQRGEGCPHLDRDLWRLGRSLTDPRVEWSRGNPRGSI